MNQVDFTNSEASSEETLINMIKLYINNKLLNF